MNKLMTIAVIYAAFRAVKRKPEKIQAFFSHSISCVHN